MDVMDGPESAAAAQDFAIVVLGQVIERTICPECTVVCNPAQHLATHDLKALLGRDGKM